MSSSLGPALPANVVVGSDWGTPVLQAKGEAFVDTSGIKLTLYWRDVWSGGLWLRNLPDIGQAPEEFPLCGFVSATARQITPGVLCEVQALFQQITSATGDSTPATTSAESGSTIRESITKHPKFADVDNHWQQWWNPNTKAFDPNYTAIPYTAAAMPDYLIGLTDFVVGSSTVSVTDYFDGEPSSIKSLLGTIGTPPGASESGYYLIISGSVNKSGKWWTRTLIYQYSSLLIPTQVYST